MIARIKNKLIFLYQRYFIGKFISEYLPFTINLFLPERSLEIKEQTVKDIVVANLDSLGDSIWVTPVFKELRERYPNAKITLVCNRICLDIFSNNPYIDEIIDINPTTFYNRIHFHLEISELSGRNIDLFLILEMGVRPSDNLKIIAHRLKAKYIISSELGILKKLSHNQPRPNSDHSPLWWPHYFLKVIEPLTDKIYTEEPALKIYPCPQAEEKIQRWLASNELLNHNLILIHPMVAGYGMATKKWPDEYYQQIISYLNQSPKNKILISGGPSEVDLCQNLINMCDTEDLILTAGQFSIKELYHLIEKCSLIMTGDTSILHLATAATRPTISLFGATNPYKIAPQSHTHIKFFHSNLECWPCHKNRDFSPYWPKCIYKEAKCLRETGPLEVIHYIHSNYPHLAIKKEE
ncbi:MAG: hypothetical protein CME63_13235 [Halobacteriovoraceae bacterium]|nr:hypothetical protein [Halobacteriovoraceae bacterium]MBC98707.1 hypothetical protein [Halobacteriovoraceae bacterium]